ncbi:MAG TPA: PQQ-binding-like beta-propeller repeat protein [Terriglobales bacterium]|nr:PQQ-binding-like beta-propeller repeat protein [Terriglobales bacterium]
MRRACAAAMALSLSLPMLAQNIPMFRGNPKHSGVYESAPVPAFHQVKWQFHTQGQVISSPAISDGAAYVGSTDGNLYAVDLATGAQRWKFPTKVRVTSSPAVAEGVVYFESYDSNFYALNAADGKLKWKFQTAGERRFAGKHLHGIEPAAESMPDPFDLYLSSPVVWNDAVYFGSGDGNVYALDAGSGQLKWKFHTADVVHASPAIADGVLFIGSWDSYFYALDAASGMEKWRFKTGEDHEIYNQVGIQSSAAVADGVVYFGCRDSNLYALDAKTGAKKWAFNNKGSWVIGSPAVKDGKVYFGTSDSSMFYALDAATGAPVFSLKFKWLMFSSPAIAGNMLYIGNHLGKLLAIDLTAQKLAWEFQTEASRQNAPTLVKSDGTPNYPAAFTENFYDNMVIGMHKMLTLGAILSSPVIADGVIYVGSTDGNLYALM